MGGRGVDDCSNQMANGRRRLWGESMLSMKVDLNLLILLIGGGQMTIDVGMECAI